MRERRLVSRIVESTCCFVFLQSQLSFYYRNLSFIIRDLIYRVGPDCQCVSGMVFAAGSDLPCLEPLASLAS